MPADATWRSASRAVLLRATVPRRAAFDLQGEPHQRLVARRESRIELVPYAWRRRRGAASGSILWRGITSLPGGDVRLRRLQSSWAERAVAVLRQAPGSELGDKAASGQ